MSLICNGWVVAICICTANSFSKNKYIIVLARLLNVFHEFCYLYLEKWFSYYWFSLVNSYIFRILLDKSY